jgi:mRNA interferase RelE/StbE
VPAKNPRVNVVLEKPLYASLSRLARREGTSLSVKARDLLREALEAYEDRALAVLAEIRDETFDRSRSLSHVEVWKAGRRRMRRWVPYLLRYDPVVAEEDAPVIPSNVRVRIARAIEDRLVAAPGQYGRPLKGSLRGYWKLRVGDYRVVFRIVHQEVWILTILHRKTVYERVASRTSWRHGAG